MINAYGRPTIDPTHEFKVLGTGRLPFWAGLSVSAVYRYATGAAWHRAVVVRGLNQGSARVRVEPNGARRLDATNLLDLRVELAFRTTGRGRLGVYLDVFNAANQGVATYVFNVSGPRFWAPQAWTSPRMLMAGLRYSLLDSAIAGCLIERNSLVPSRSPIADRRSPSADCRSPIADRRSPSADCRSPIADRRLPIAGPPTLTPACALDYP